MNRSLRKSLFREIRSSFPRFLSILVMVALGTLFLVGLRSAAPDMRKTADGYYDDHDFYDIQILSTLGLTGEDIRAFSEVEGVEQVQGNYSLDAVVERPEGNLVVKAHSLNGEDGAIHQNSVTPELPNINRTELLEGHFPETASQCVVEQRFLDTYGYALGDKLTLTLGEGMEDALTREKFEIVGVVESPLYISIDRGTSSLGDGAVDAYIMLPGAAFDLDYFTEANLTVSGAKELDPYSEEYGEKIDEMKDRLTAVAEERGRLRYETLVSEAQEKLETARGELETARAEAEQELSQAQSELNDAREPLDQGWAELNAAKEQLAAAAGAYGETAWILSYQDALRETQTQLETAQQTYDENAEAFETAKQETEEKLSDAKAEIDQGQTEIDEMEPAEIYVLDRDSNYGFVSYDQNAQRMDNLANTLPLVFFIVAALVCLTTMTRMVEEQRTEIGAIKAMGYGTGTIAWKFILYGTIAALIGGLLGVLIGTTLIPWVIFTSYAIMYTLPDLHLELYWGLSIGAVAAGLFCTVGATLWAMLNTARETPAALMRPKAPRAGKRIFLERIPFLWKRLSFSIKVSCRNLLRYKKRFFMTVIGIAGCTALIIAGLGLRSSIFSIIEVQYGDIYRYNLLVSLDTEEEPALSSVHKALEESENVESSAEAYTRAVTISAGGSQDGYLTVTDDLAGIQKEIDFRTLKGKEHLDIPRDGALISEKLAELLDVQVGDTITVECGEKAQVPVAGIVEHYVRHYVYMDARLFEELFDQEYAPNELMVTTLDDSDEAISQLSEELMKLDGVSAASNVTATAKNFEETLNAVNAAVTIIILSAAALALVVLYNLTNINITERIRELATIKVLGFFDREVAMYIYRENIALTVLGIALGQVFGKFLCSYLIRTVEIDIVMFGRAALPGDYIGATVLSLLFALLVNFMMFFRMRKINMVASLKSVE